MNMNKQLFFACILWAYAAATASAQTWAPIGAKWTYGYRFAFWPTWSYNEWTSVGDTLIDGQPCRIIALSSGIQVTSDYENRFITYEDSSGAVHWYRNGAFSVFFDINKTVGESWVTRNDSCEIVMTVDSVDVETINGSVRRVVYASSTSGAWGAWGSKFIEGIGCVTQPTPDLHYVCFHSQPDGTIYLGLRCYEDSILGAHRFQTNIPCDHTYTHIRPIGVEESVAAAEAALVLYPNPASDRLYVRGEQAAGQRYSVYDALGRQVQSGILPSEGGISVVGLGAGIYTLEIQDSEGKRQRALFVRRG